MITALHTIIYAEDAEQARTFFRDVLGWEHVNARDGWLIFKAGPAELAMHPTGPGSDASAGPRHEITLMCDDIEATVQELEAKGVEFTRAVRDDGWGLTTTFRVPGAGEMMLYAPRHPTAFDL